MNVDALVENARGNSVTKETLTDSSEGGLLSNGYPSLRSFLDEGEQPHFLFEFFEETGLDRMGEKGDQYKGKHHHLLVTDQFVRSVSSAVDKKFGYTSVLNAGVESGSRHYVFRIETQGQGSRSFMLNDRGALQKSTDPSELRDAAEYVQMRSAEASAGGRTSSRNGPSPTEKLEELQEMAERGLISETEYQAKRAEILGNM